MKHDDIIDDIVDKLLIANRMDFVDKNCEYHVIINDKDICGEYDISAYNYDNKAGYVMEIKTTDTPYNRRKALQQLDKDVEYMKQNYVVNNVYCFYGYSLGSSYNIEFIKKVNISPDENVFEISKGSTLDERIELFSKQKSYLN